MTAVEQLIEAIKERGGEHMIGAYQYLFEQAKAIEKQQIVDAWNAGNESYSIKGNADNYYKYTFEEPLTD